MSSSSCGLSLRRLLYLRGPTCGWRFIAVLRSQWWIRWTIKSFKRQVLFKKLCNLQRLFCHLGSRKKVRADRTRVWSHSLAVVGVRPRVVRPNVFTQNNALIECAGTYGTSIRLLASVNAFVLAQRATVGKRLPTIATAVRTFTWIANQLYYVEKSMCRITIFLIEAREFCLST